MRHAGSFVALVMIYTFIREMESVHARGGDEGAKDAPVGHPFPSPMCRDPQTPSALRRTS